MIAARETTIERRRCPLLIVWAELTVYVKKTVRSLSA